MSSPLFSERHSIAVSQLAVRHRRQQVRAAESNPFGLWVIRYEPKVVEQREMNVVKGEQ